LTKFSERNQKGKDGTLYCISSNQRHESGRLEKTWPLWMTW